MYSCILLFSPVQIIITHPLKALQKETSINILEGKIKKKTDSMKEVKALQKETSIKILEGKIKKKTDSMEEVKALHKETSKASNSKVISYSRIPLRLSF